MESIKSSRTTHSTGNDSNLTPIETDPEHILRKEKNSSFQTEYKNLGIEMQERETVNAHEHGSAVRDKEPSQDPVPKHSATHSPPTSQNLHAVMWEMERDKAG